MGRDGQWQQEEIFCNEEGYSIKHVPLRDPVIKHVLDCALNCQIPIPPLWERLYDLAVGRPGLRLMTKLFEIKFQIQNYQYDILCSQIVLVAAIDNSSGQSGCFSHRKCALEGLLQCI